MPKRKLTDVTIRNLPAPPSGQIDFFDQLLPAFGIRVSNRGTRSYFVMTRISGHKRLRRMTLGRYPAMPLAQAREKARQILEAASMGADPFQALEADKIVQRKKRDTFEDVTAEFVELYASRKLRPATIRDYKRTFDTVCASWKNVSIGDLKRRDVLLLIDRIEARKRLALADATHRYLSRFFNWCVERDYIETSPMAGIRRSHAVKPRDRVLDFQELAEIWSALEQLDYPFNPLLKVLFLTGQRRGEVAGMRWSELKDWETASPLWEIPGHRTKNHLTHLVPIIPAVKSIIASCPRMSDYVFSTTGKTGASGFSKAKVRINALINEARANRGLSAAMPRWTFHDFRRAFSTHAHETLSVEPHVVEAVLNHVSGTKAGVAGVYNRAAYLDGRRKALERWADQVHAQCDSSRPGLDLRQAASQ